jgi:hypothetical protein
MLEQGVLINALLRFHRVVTHLSSLVDSTVEHARFNVWPEIDWPEYGETQLVLNLRNANDEVRCTKFFIDDSQEHMTVAYVNLEEGKPFDAIEERFQCWKDPIKGFNVVWRDWEVFDLDKSGKYNWLINDRIKRFELILWISFFTVAEIAIEFHSGKKLWVTQGIDGCRVRDDGTGLKIRGGEIAVVIDEYAIQLRQ